MASHVITTINTMKAHMDPIFISWDLTHLTPTSTPQLEFLTRNQKSTLSFFSAFCHVLIRIGETEVIFSWRRYLETDISLQKMGANTWLCDLTIVHTHIHGVLLHIILYSILIYKLGLIHCGTWNIISIKLNDFLWSESKL